MKTPLRWLMLGLTLMGLALRLYYLGAPSLWYDELLELDIAQGSIRNIMPQMSLHAAMPLDYFLLHIWLKLSHADMWVRFPAAWFGTLAIPLLYQLGRVMFNRSVGVIAALLLAIHPFAIHYSQEARPYSLLLLLVLATYWGVWQAYRTHRWRYWGIALSGLLMGSLTHYFALIVWLPLGLYVAGQQLYHGKELRYRGHTATFMLALFILTLVLLIVGRPWVLYSVSYGFTQAITQPSQLTAPNKPNGGSGPPIKISFFTDAMVLPLTTSHSWGVFLYSGCFLVAVLRLTRRPIDKSHQSVILLLGWLIIPCLIIYLFLLQRGTFFATRYILYTLPACLLLVAYGATQLFLLRKIHYEAIFWSFLLTFSQFSSLNIYYQTPAYEDWRAVGQLLHAEARPDDAVIAIRAEPTINWYYPPARQPFHTYSTLEAVQLTIDAHSRRWFILSSYSAKQDAPIRQWLQRHGAVHLPIDNRVAVYFQQRGLSHRETLAQVAQFDLPPLARTHAELAAQFCEIHNRTHCQQFYQQAMLWATPKQRAEYMTRLEEMGLK